MKNLLPSRNSNIAKRFLPGIILGVVLAFALIRIFGVGSNDPLVLVPDTLKANAIQSEGFQATTFIENHSNASWKLTRFVPNCDCTQGFVEPDVLLPGTSGTINLVVNTGRPGSNKIIVATEWQEVDWPHRILRRNLSILMNVKSLLTLQPASFSLGSIQWDALEKGISVEVNRGDSGLLWNNITVESSAFKTDVSRKDENHFYISALPNTKEPRYGYFSERLNVVARNEAKALSPSFSIPIKAWIDPGVKVTPSTIFSNKLSASTITSGTILLEREGEKFRVIDVSVPESNFLHFDSIEQSEDTAKLHYTMSGDKEGQHSGIVTVTVLIGAEKRKFSIPYIVFVNGYETAATGSALEKPSSSSKK